MPLSAAARRATASRRFWYEPARAQQECTNAAPHHGSTVDGRCASGVPPAARASARPGMFCHSVAERR